MAVDMAMPILIVDDYKTMLRIIRNLLKQLGFKDDLHAATDLDTRDVLPLYSERLITLPTAT